MAAAALLHSRSPLSCTLSSSSSSSSSTVTHGCQTCAFFPTRICFQGSNFRSNERARRLLVVECSTTTQGTVAPPLPPPPQSVEAPAGSDLGKLNKYSSRVTQPKSQGASQAILYGVGLSAEDMDKPQVYGD
jgi:hypothetical protein